MNEIVMGLHWKPGEPQHAVPTPDLDALCVLLDAENHVIDVISPSRPRTATDSVVHTGNSHDGASQWDDERIFAFLEALPASVSQVAFCVFSVNGHPFARVPGARCHLSDARSEHVYARLDLTSMQEETFLVAFQLRKEIDAWQITCTHPATSAILRSLVLRLHAEQRDVEANLEC